MGFFDDDEDLTCPYCGAVQECHEPDEIDADFATEECERCGKTFEYSVTVTRQYSSSKTDDDQEDDLEDDYETY